MTQTVPIELFMAQVHSLPVSDGARAHFLQLLRAFAGSRIYLNRSVLMQPGLMDLACKLLAEGMAIAEARDALEQRTGVSRRSAYRAINLALEARRGAYTGGRHHGNA